MTFVGVDRAGLVIEFEKTDHTVMMEHNITYGVPKFHGATYCDGQTGDCGGIKDYGNSPATAQSPGDISK